LYDIRLIIYHSTGGLTAIALGENGWTLRQCKDAFKDFSPKAFTPREFHSVPIFQQLATVRHGSIYKTQPMYRALKETLGTGSFFGGTHTNDSISRNKTKVAVTATSQEGKRAILIANYNRSSKKINDDSRRRDRPVYKFLRPRDPAEELATWEAVAATSSAPPYFKPYFHTSSYQYFLDGSFYNNNPAKVAQQERMLLWPEVADRAPDIFLSIGTSQYQRDVEGQMDEIRKGGSRPL
jgi:patatin-like phospholipase/acyl hydrolase